MTHIQSVLWWHFQQLFPVNLSPWWKKLTPTTDIWHSGVIKWHPFFSPVVDPIRTSCLSLFELIFSQFVALYLYSFPAERHIITEEYSFLPPVCVVCSHFFVCALISLAPNQKNNKHFLLLSFNYIPSLSSDFNKVSYWRISMFSLDVVWVHSETEVSLTCLLMTVGCLHLCLIQMNGFSSLS